MEYKRYNDTLVLRLDKGDEIISSLAHVAEKERIKTASFSGIGATDNFTVGIFSLEKQTYDGFSFTGNHEITCLSGNITSVDGKPYIHAHITCAGENANVVGGHLLEAKISLTCEIFIDAVDGEVTRKRDEKLNINRFDF
ncbi:MAG: DNA-binding protein [Clostridia bacterium]|nr:DNA-binding protein [Clostridia bacterium]